MASYRYDVFLSFSSADRPAVEELAWRLEAQKLALFFDEWEMIAGRPNQVVLAEAMRDSKTCAVFLGPSRLGPWQKEEIQVAIGHRVGDPEFHVIPVLLPGAERPRRGDVAHLDFLINSTWVEFARTLDDERAFDRLVCGIKGLKHDHQRGREINPNCCPYRGLEAFMPDDVAFFFGRANLTSWLVSDLRRELRSAQGVRLLAVLGPSGSGKSSVVLAGLVPRLKEGAIAGSERWPIAVLRPSSEPVRALANALSDPRVAPSHLGKEVFDRIDKQENGLESLHVAAGRILGEPPTANHLLVIVDQFEEVFTSRPEDSEVRARFDRDRERFFGNVLHAAAAPGGRVVVVLTMRSDFLGACASLPRLNDALNAHVEQVGPLREEELREAIEQPAYLVGCELEGGLAEVLLDNVEGQAGALPLLQFALKELWAKRDVRRLTRAAYKTMGGVQGALEQRANEIYRSLDSEDQDICRRIFLRLVQLGEGTEDTKRRVSFGELLPDDPTRAEAVRKVLFRLADPEARLITTEGAYNSAAEGTVEVAHEALIGHWKQLRDWIDSDRAGLRIHRKLTEAAYEWNGALSESKADFLYTGTRLAEASEWAARHSGELSPTESALLTESQAAERRRQADEVSFWRRLAATAAVAAAVLIGITLFAIMENRRAQESQSRAIAAQKESKDQEQAARREAQRADMENRQARESEFRAIAAQKESKDQERAARREAQRADMEANRATSEADAAKRNLSFVESMFELADPYKAKGQTITAREILDQGAHKIDELKDQPRDQAELMEIIGNLYRKLAIYADAKPLLKHALAIRKEVLGERDRDRDTATSLNNLALLLEAQGDYAAAKTLCEQALAIRKEVLGARHCDTATSLGEAGSGTGPLLAIWASKKLA